MRGIERNKYIGCNSTATIYKPSARGFIRFTCTFRGIAFNYFAVMKPGSAVRLTIARYYSPLGRNIQKSYSKGKEQYEEELAARFH